MIDAKDATIWVHRDRKEILVLSHSQRPYTHSSAGWADPIGTAFGQWRKQSDAQRVQLMEETAIDLAMQGFSLKEVLIAFAQVRQFRALGAESFPMCRALTTALLGRTYEANTMTFEELLKHYAPSNRKSETT